eukprot:1138128-Pelagomonas_calceolata.AAC.8
MQDAQVRSHKTATEHSLQASPASEFSLLHAKKWQLGNSGKLSPASEYFIICKTWQLSTSSKHTPRKHRQRVPLIHKQTS